MMELIYKLFGLSKLGVDLGQRNIKGIKLRKKGKRIYLDKYLLHDLSQTTDEFPYKKNLSETLKAMVELNKL